MRSANNDCAHEVSSWSTCFETENFRLIVTPSTLISSTRTKPEIVRGGICTALLLLGRTKIISADFAWFNFKLLWLAHLSTLAISSWHDERPDERLGDPPQGIYRSLYWSETGMEDPDGALPVLLCVCGGSALSGEVGVSRSIVRDILSLPPIYTKIFLPVFIVYRLLLGYFWRCSILL